MLIQCFLTVMIRYFTFSFAVVPIVPVVIPTAINPDFMITEDELYVSLLFELFLCI